MKNIQTSLTKTLALSLGLAVAGLSSASGSDAAISRRNASISGSAAGMPFLANETKMPHRNDFDAADLGKTACYAARWVNTKGDGGPWSLITGWIIN